MAKVKLLDPSDPRRRLDRYELIGEIATGGMATVFLARRSGVGGFQRFVAIKRLHPHLQNEPEFVEMFLDEARLAALIHHPNVVPILEVGESETGYYLVMEYVEGDTLSRIVARTMSLGQLPPRHVVLRMVLDALAGLHAAHELRDDRGQLLGLVHRDVSPQNVLVGVDGTARITDFGVARASSRLTSTAHGKLKGKLAYMAPEQTRGDELDRRTDLFAMGIILWEVLCARRLFKADSEAATLQRILVEPVRPPSEILPAIPKIFDTVVLRALDRDATKRFQTAADFGDALEAAAREAAKAEVTDVGLASPREVASFVQQILGQEIGAQRESVRAWLAQSDSGQPVVIHPSSPPSPRQIPAPTPSALDAAAAALVAGNKPASNKVPRFEVAADITMRFALESQPDEASPTPAEPPPPPEPIRPPRSPLPPPPRLPPPPKQSSPTLLGQGPPQRSSSSRPPPESATLAGVGDSPVQKYAAKISEDVGDDVETVARPHPMQPVIQPAVKTARGLQAAELLKEARAKADAEGWTNGGASSSSVPPPMSGANGVHANGAASKAIKTPRMPMPADQMGEPKVQIAPGSSRPPPMDYPARPIPRTLVSANGGEVSAGGMTLSAGSVAPAHRSDSSLDPTIVHAMPKRGIAKYLIAVAVLLLIGATAAIFIKSRPTEVQAEKTGKPRDKETAAATSTAAAKATEDRKAASAEPLSSVTTLSAAPTATETAPRPTGNRRVPPTTAKTGDKPAPTSEPKTTTSGGDEDFSNPYR